MHSLHAACHQAVRSRTILVYVPRSLRNINGFVALRLTLVHNVHQPSFVVFNRLRANFLVLLFASAYNVSLFIHFLIYFITPLSRWLYQCFRDRTELFIINYSPQKQFHSRATKQLSSRLIFLASWENFNAATPMLLCELLSTFGHFFSPGGNRGIFHLSEELCWK